MAHGRLAAILGLGPKNAAGAGTGLNSLAQLAGEGVQTLGASSGGATACDANSGRIVIVPVLTENTTITVSNLVTGQSMVFFITQHASVAKTVAFAGVLWAGGAAPTISAGASAKDVITLLKVGTNTFGFVSGQALA